MRRLMRACAAAVLAVSVTAAAAQPPGGGRGMGGGAVGPAGLMMSKSVQTELKVTDEQADKLKTWGQEAMRKQFQGMRERFESLKELEPAEAAKKRAEYAAEDSKKAYAELADVLKPEQVKRLRQIQVQAAGAMAFAMPEVTDALKPTDEQKDKIKDAAEAYGREARELAQEMGMGGPGGGGGKGERPDPAKRQEFDKKRGALLKEMMAKVEGVLTADQKAAWTSLTGATIDVPKVQAEMQQAMGGMFRKKKDD